MLVQIEDHPLVTFLPLDLTLEDSIENVVSHIDFTMQYGEDEEPKEVRASFFISICLTGASYLSLGTWIRATFRIQMERTNDS